MSALALGTIRVWAILRVQAVWRTALGPVWELLALAFGLLVTLSMVSGQGAVEPGGVVHWFELAVCEFVGGTVVGLLASLPGHALVGAAGTQAQMLRTTPGAWSARVVVLVATLAMALQVHHASLDALSSILATWKVGQPQTWVVVWAVDDLVRAAQ